jgi:hypothetical protein
LTLTSGGAHWIVDDIAQVVGTGALRRCSHRSPQEVAEVWQSDCRGISSFRPSCGAHDAIVATTAVGLNQFNDLATAVGVMPIVELASVVVSEPVMPPRAV